MIVISIACAVLAQWSPIVTLCVRASIQTITKQLNNNNNNISFLSSPLPSISSRLSYSFYSHQSDNRFLISTLDDDDDDDDYDRAPHRIASLPPVEPRVLIVIHQVKYRCSLGPFCRAVLGRAVRSCVSTLSLSLSIQFFFFFFWLLFSFLLRRLYYDVDVDDDDPTDGLLSAAFRSNGCFVRYLRRSLKRLLLHDNNNNSVSVLPRAGAVSAPARTIVALCVFVCCRLN